MNKTQEILANYEGMNAGVLTNLSRVLNAGKLAGSGKVVILPVDQGFEHGPEKSFAQNPAAYDPHYHFQLAIDAGLSAFAAPLGLLESGATKFAGQVPLILKLNHSSLLGRDSLTQAIIASASDALELGCVGIGLTIYPGSSKFFTMLESLKLAAHEAKKLGLIVVVWAYARGEHLPKTSETALDIISYSAHMACLAGAHIVKVKLPESNFHDAGQSKCFENSTNLTSRVAHIVRSCFEGRRLVVFSGGLTKDSDCLFDEVQAIRDGGGSGSIIGRNSFQRPRQEALDLLERVVKIYKNQDEGPNSAQNQRPE